jgi:hypothetical protein
MNSCEKNAIITVILMMNVNACNRFFDISFVRRRYRKWIHFAVDAKTVGRIPETV